MRILVADDGSEGAAEAVTLASSLSWPNGTAIRAISVFEPLPIRMAGPWPAPVVTSPDLENAIAEQIGALNKHATERLAASGRIVDGVVRRGRAATAIVDEAEAFGADLVVIGSRGHGQIASLLLGSVSNEVVDQAPCPVLVARNPALGRVVFATDGSPAAAAAEAILAMWPIFASTPIRVVSVAEVEFPWTSGIAPTLVQAAVDAYTADLREAREAHRRIVDEAGARLRSAGRTVEVEVREGGAASEILAAAGEREADLIVVGSRGNTGLKRLLLGSVARNLLHSSTASVLVVRD
jgi:nucleotide-binding universal stress UspA family protein